MSVLVSTVDGDPEAADTWVFSPSRSERAHHATLPKAGPIKAQAPVWIHPPTNDPPTVSAHRPSSQDRRSLPRDRVCISPIAQHVVGDPGQVRGVDTAAECHQHGAELCEEIAQRVRVRERLARCEEDVFGQHCTAHSGKERDRCIRALRSCVEQRELGAPRRAADAGRLRGDGEQRTERRRRRNRRARSWRSRRASCPTGPR